MKVKFVCDSGANIHSARTEVIDTNALGYSDEEWETLSDDDKYEMVSDWANNYLSIYWEEL